MRNAYITEQCERVLENKGEMAKWKERHPFNPEEVEIVYTSCQSWKNFDPRVTAEPGKQQWLYPSWY